ncbi:hypothetical protein DRE_06050 [Drechslerella stenobrocha 248]|uniref:Uncharacterized protein n=1 Tax=Drechslerella stenobrocha 248 TaxID=1043628 RepID=W7HYD4_9PEZI|nr:hypothetical protein DRE_06050 [Drechslerella stenobrocha 248]
MAAHAAKRPRLHGPDRNRDPALSLASTSSLLESSRQAAASTPKLRSIQLEHENSLRQSALRLKSNWEDICQRYSRDFKGQDDIIDLQTGKVVVDNGHLRTLSEPLDDNTWALDGDDEYDDGNDDECEEGEEEEEAEDRDAETNLEMEIIGMMGGHRLGFQMRRDEGAEGTRADETEVECDAIDELFDELDARNTTAETETAGLGEKNRPPSKPQGSGSAQLEDQIRHDSLLSPVSSEPVEEPAHLPPRPAGKDLEKGHAEIPPSDELPPENVIIGLFGVERGSAMLAFARTLVEAGQVAEEGQLTPVSDYGKTLSEDLAGEVDPAEPATATTMGANDSDSGADTRKEAEASGFGVRLECTAGTGTPAELLEADENAPRAGALDAVDAAEHEVDMSEDELEAAPGDGTLHQPFIIEDSPEPTINPPTIEEPPQQPRPEAEMEEGETSAFGAREAETSILREPAIETEPAAHGPDAMEDVTNCLQADIDELSTILQPQPRSRIPITPKNQFRFKSRNIVSTRRKPSKPRHLGKQQQPQSSPLKPKQPYPSTPSEPPRNQARQPLNFWSALPDDPFYDPKWQDSHPDGEPLHEAFEQKKRLLQEHALRKGEQSSTAPDDDPTPPTSSPAKARKTPRAKRKAATPSTSRSRKAKLDEAAFESKLHTPRSGSFLQYLHRKSGGSAVKVNSNANDLADASASPSRAGSHGGANTLPETPVSKPQNEYGLSDSEDELSRELWSVQDKNSAGIQGMRKPKNSARRRGDALPLVVPDDPNPPTPSRNSGSVTNAGEDYEADQIPSAACGDPGYCCKKTICFKCIGDQTA